MQKAGEDVLTTRLRPPVLRRLYGFWGLLLVDLCQSLAESLAS